MTTYTRKPIGTAHVILPLDLERLTEKLAEKVYDHWARQRLLDGWRYGPTRDAHNKRHPSLVPYALLPESEKTYDRQAAVATLKAIIAVGWQITKATSNS